MSNCCTPGGSCHTTAEINNPMIAGAAMAFSSVFVVGNSLRLRGFQAADH